MPAINFGIYNASIIPTLCTRHKVWEWGNNSYYDLHALSQSHVNRIAFPHFLLFSVHKVKQEHVCGHVILQGDFQRVEGLGNLPRYPAERDPVFSEISLCVISPNRLSEKISRRSCGILASSRRMIFPHRLKKGWLRFRDFPVNGDWFAVVVPCGLEYDLDFGMNAVHSDVLVAGVFDDLYDIHSIIPFWGSSLSLCSHSRRKQSDTMSSATVSFRT